MKAYEDLARIKVDEALQQGQQGTGHRQADTYLPADFGLLVDAGRAGGTRHERRRLVAFWQVFSAGLAQARASFVLRARALLRGT